VDAFGVTRGGQAEIALRLPQSDLGQLLGVGRQRVNAELKGLEEAGLIAVARETITVLDLPALRTGACRIGPLTLTRARAQAAGVPRFVGRLCAT
jgi:hypothetical protein